LSESVTGIFGASAATFAASNRGPSTKALYQWLSRRARFFRPAPSGVSRTVRTEIKVERRDMTLRVGGVTGFDVCPFCGQKLAPGEAEQARLRLQEGSIPPTNVPVDGTSS
jgi:hypothetical protein